MDCLYCKKTYSTNSSLLHHQRTAKLCLKIQNSLGVANRQIFDCNFCKKPLTSKYNLENHLSVCKTKQLETTKLLCVQESNELLKNTELLLKTRINELETKLKETETELNELKKSLTKTKKSAIPKFIKTMVWNKYVGSAIAETLCICCQQEKISIRHFHCGHIIPESTGGTLELENLRPICAPCNSCMGNRNMREFVKTFFNREI